ncbi:MAG: lipopolysaccharide core heptose(I) kinase RfaP [Gammaproteobacteria bacterium]|nr:MAG: lipopolysaccharide core heptose(I) kinase RfaP [Gammaproteobacteria bacterium]
MIFVRNEFKPLFPETLVADFLKIEGETVKHVVEDRHTFRFERGGRLFYMKAHFGVGWKEITKNLITLKAPVLGARNEWQAIRAFERLGVPTMTIVAYGESGINPAHRKSFLITDALEQTEDLEQWLPTLDLHRPEDVKLKREIIRKLGAIARVLHQRGLNHRDFYLCHFRLDLSHGKPDPDSVKLYVMDLHRVQQHRRQVPRRWAIKDLAALLYSALHSCRHDPGYSGNPSVVTVADLFRFVAAYSSQPWPQALKQDCDLWTRVLRRVLRLCRRDRHHSDNSRDCLPPALTRFL